MKNNWSKEEHIVAFNLYCKTPFTKINSSNKDVKELASVIGRSVGSVAMKLANFARLDPALQARNISGLTQGAKGEEEVWNEFNGNWNELAWQSELILAKYKSEPVEQSAEITLLNLPEGKEREVVIKARVNQSFFRKTVLASYNQKCCITGITLPELLIAGHIIPWSHNVDNRVNPSNGLCLNALHDLAYDKGLISITPDYEIKLSDKLLHSFKKDETELFFSPYENKKINLPTKFLPKKEFLDYHVNTIFQK
ncbi:MAG: HNH endonuclease [Flavobacterium sp.]